MADRTPRPSARSQKIPQALAPELAARVAEALGADAEAVTALREALAGKRFTAVISVGRTDMEEFTTKDMQTLRALQPSAPAAPAAKPSARVTTKAVPAKATAKKRSAAKKPARGR